MRGRFAAAFLLCAFSLVTPSLSQVQPDRDFPLPGTKVIQTEKRFDDLWADLEKAVEAKEMIVVARASASRGAATRGVSIPGNAVIEVFRNDFAVRMLKESVAAGYEAPLRFYVIEREPGSALVYRTPSAVFAPYGGEGLKAMAAELDEIFALIAQDAAGR